MQNVRLIALRPHQRWQKAEERAGVLGRQSELCLQGERGLVEDEEGSRACQTETSHKCKLQRRT